MKVSPLPGGYKLAEIKVQIVKPEWFYLWPDGSYCTPEELHEYQHMSDDFEKVQVIDYHEDGTPVFPK